MLSHQQPTVPELLGHHVRRSPSACAVLDRRTGGSLTYGELWQRAGALAADLADRGVRPGSLVAVAAGPSIDLVVALTGVLRAGAAYVPLDPHAPAARVATILRDCGDPPVVVGGGAAGRLPAGHPVLPVPDGPAADDLDLPPADDDEAVAYVSFTSGSTGKPKGVLVPHRAIARLVVSPNYCTVAPGDRVAGMANPAFDATTFELWGALTAGATVVVLPTPAELPVEQWLGLVADTGVDTMFLTTSMFHTIARERPDAFAGLGTLVVGGEQLDLELTRRVLDAGPPGRLVNGYGPTETTTFATAYHCTRESLRDRAKVPIGFALQRTELHVLDDDLSPVAPGEQGELCVGGPGVALGYLGRPELTASKFVADPRTGQTLYRTGDIVRETADGALELLGRRDRQVKLRGFRIELEEIEHAAVATRLAGHVFVEKVGDGAQATLVGFALPAPGVVPADLPGLLRDRLTERLPGYMIPGRWVVLDVVPLGPTGKADRTAMLAAISPQRTAGNPAGLDLVGAVVAEVLGGVEVAATDNFLDLGGNSILAVQVASRLGARLAATVDPAELLLAETMAEFAATLPGTAVRTA
ncbi:non-ribosomal peptide synthetase [Amycolatopsis balhimycina]|uniref:non-ribosomal peptide synthetase n=1 Tax=Amycolatopsis balhimycina TaxID=208443 RepID=UPI0021ADCE15|nr:non-ribosomal peptide synthetase [Amycolatopsis balhimycina]